jgi:2-hydroxychromene-2-carboxylate isomerase
MGCLAEKGVKIYGANWCGWTKKFVVETIGGFDVAAPIYVECTKNEAECAAAGVSGYPTTKINGEPYNGERTLEGLAKATGCVVSKIERSQTASQQAPETQTAYTQKDLAKITEFSECLAEKGVKIYGANWCGWTKKFVVETLGGADTVAPIYVECTENEAECSSAGVSGYPTTKINGEPYSGARTIEGLAQATGCIAPELEGTVQQAATPSAAPSGGCGA